MVEGTVKFEDHDADDSDFKSLLKKHGLKAKTKGDVTTVTGPDPKIQKMLKTMKMEKDEEGYAVLEAVQSEGSKEEYKKFFDKKLAKWKIKSPAELSDEDKKKFFSEIEKEWTGDKDEEVVKEYIKKDGARRRCAGGDGRKNRKVKTEEEDCEDDEEMEEAKSLPAQDWYEGSLYFESAQRDAEVSITVTDSAPDNRGAKKIILEAMMEIAEGMEWFVQNNKRDIKIKKK